MATSTYSRYGMVNVHVLIGVGVLLSDLELFFGPVHPNDVWIVDPVGERANLAQLMTVLGLYESVKDAERHGWRRPIPDGFSDHMRVKKINRVTILKIVEPMEER